MFDKAIWNEGRFWSGSEVARFEDHPKLVQENMHIYIHIESNYVFFFYKLHYKQGREANYMLRNTPTFLYMTDSKQKETY